MGTTGAEAKTADKVLAGRYRLGELLGRGGMAEVYEAFDERLHRPVAVKILLPQMAARADVRQRFEAEARSAARLTHPNVVGVYDSGEDDGMPFLVMEKLPGETLADRMHTAAASGEPLPTDWLLRAIGDVLLALGAAHAAGLVHRDVKPANMLIGSDGCAKVADFGIAKSLEVATAGDLTVTNQLVGTPAYVAPERIVGDPATPQSDLYAVGVVLYEALAGQKPFSGATPVATAYSIRHETPAPLAERRPDLPASLVATVERAMAREPADRFGTAEEMASALGVSASGAAAHASDATVVATPVDATQVIPVADVVPIDALVPTAGATTAGSERADRRREPFAVPAFVQDNARPLVLGSLALLVLALLLVGIAAAGGGKEDGRGELADEVRAVASMLAPAKDGPAATEAKAQLREVADSIEAGNGPAAANAFLRQLGEWRDRGQLTPSAVNGIATVLFKIPGVDRAALPPPTTAAPAPTQPPGEDKKKGDEKKKDKDDD